MFGLTKGISRAKALSLDALRSNVMMADNKLNITYMNRSLVVLLQEAEEDIRQELPRFNVRSLIGSNIDVLHKNPSHQRNMLEKLEKPHFATIHLGKRKFDLNVTPIMSGNRRDGFVVEWLNALERIMNADLRNQIAAISRSQAMIEFTTDGIIQHANENFLKVIGYPLEEIVGKHHKIFMDPAESSQPEYAKFWETLQRGDFQAGEFKRIRKGGQVIWIRGSYGPIMDENGKVAKVIKYAVDVTERVRAVQGIGAGLKELAGKNLQYRLTSRFSEEFEPVRLDFNASLENLQATITSITENTLGVRSGVGEIAQASDDLSRRTEQQAASLEETAAALDEITATVKKTAVNANDARNLVSSAKADAERSREVVDKTVNAMNEIENFSKKIGNIIGVIDEIAFQTNLLALNAGVEAARAGDAGRGFAVVATEVRALAQRSADAAKEIKELISTSSQQVEIGVKLVGETGNVLVTIVEQVAKLNSLVTDIAASAKEQATGLGEVNSAVNQMDQVTQQNAAMVEEATAACHNLTVEADELKQLVGQFKVGESAMSNHIKPPAQKSATVPAAKPRNSGRTATGKPRPVLETANAENWDEF